MRKPKPWEASYPGERRWDDYGFSWYHGGVKIPIDEKTVLVDFSKGKRVSDDDTPAGLTEMKQWCKANRIAVVNHNKVNHTTVAFRFRTAQEATHFKLVWG